ncbi:hypothetical protein C8R45DRAFT_2533 [Mycena sanguinolenta]|nr:hypothetical protein C8R45DRAFT_2533 [Mycena sanguinolenta]
MLRRAPYPAFALLSLSLSPNTALTAVCYSGFSTSLFQQLAAPACTWNHAILIQTHNRSGAALENPSYSEDVAMEDFADKSHTAPDQDAQMSPTETISCLPQFDSWSSLRRALPFADPCL